MNTKTASMLLAGAMIVSTIVPAFAKAPSTNSAPAKSTKVCAKKSSKLNKISKKKAAAVTAPSTVSEPKAK